MSCLCIEEFSTKRLHLSYPHSLAFSTSPFVALPLFVLYRLVVTFYCLAWLVVSGYHYHDYFFIYLSNWTFILVTAYLFGGLYHSLILCTGGGDHDEDDDGDFGLSLFGTHRFKSETYIVGLTSSDDSATEGESDARLCPPYKSNYEEEDNTRTYHKITWILFTLASTNSLVATGLFWFVQFHDQPVDGLTLTVHTLGSVFLLLEVVMSNIPVRLLHHLYAHIFLAVYILFTVMYWAAGGEDDDGNRFIYRALNYEDDPAQAVGCVFLILIIALPLIHTLFFGLFRLRGWVVSKLD